MGSRLSYGKGKGCWNRILVVDLARRQAEVRALPDKVLQQFLGGSGLGVHLLRQFGDPAIDPFDPRNPLIFAPGLLTGTLVPGMTRYSVVGKAPLTGIFGEATAGGTFGAELRFCGLDALVLTGVATEPVYVWVNDDRVEIRSARHLWGQDTFETNAILQAETDEKARVACIGPAGERRVLFAAIMSEGEQARAAGRTGLGAVMGAKNVKALAVRGSRGVGIHDPLEMLRWTAPQHPQMSPRFGAFTKYGTTAAIEIHEERGALGIKNWASDDFRAGAPRISGKAIEARYTLRQSSCNGCPVHCWVVLNDKNGPEVAHGRGPEYETLGALGSMILVEDLPAVVRANELANRLGMGTISLGSAIAFAIECFERGLLSQRATDGLSLRFGDGELMCTLVERIGHRQPGLGDLLANGTRMAARQIGRGAEDLTVEVKGLDFPMHDPRAFWSSALNYACGSRGACHLDALAFAVESGVQIPEFGYNSKQSPFTADGKALLVQRMHDLMGLYNALGLCKFYIRALAGPRWLSEAINIATGWGITGEKLMEAGERIFQAKRLFNVEAGVTRADDTVPKRIVTLDRNERHRAVPVEAFEKMRDEYYALRGWDAEGRPRPATLRKLGLNLAKRLPQEAVPVG